MNNVTGNNSTPTLNDLICGGSRDDDNSNDDGATTTTINYDAIEVRARTHPHEASRVFMDDTTKRLPLHVLSYDTEAPPSTFRALIEAYPEALIAQDALDDTPLHLACWFLSPVVSQLFLDYDDAASSSCAALVRGNGGFLPLHLACNRYLGEDNDNGGDRGSGGNDWSPVVQRLLLLHPGGATARDEEGRTPMAVLWKRATTNIANTGSAVEWALNVSLRAHELTCMVLLAAGRSKRSSPDHEEEENNKPRRTSRCSSAAPEDDENADKSSESFDIVHSLAAWGGCCGIPLLLRKHVTLLHREQVWRVDRDGCLPIHYLASANSAASGTSFHEGDDHDISSESGGDAADGDSSGTGAITTAAAAATRQYTSAREDEEEPLQLLQHDDKRSSIIMNEDHSSRACRNSSTFEGSFLDHDGRSGGNSNDDDDDRPDVSFSSSSRISLNTDDYDNNNSVSESSNDDNDGDDDSSKDSYLEVDEERDDAAFLLFLLELYPRGASRKDRTGRTALHRALSAGKSLETGVGVLWNASPTTAGTIDPVTGLFPFQLAAAAAAVDGSTTASATTALDCVYFLLRKNPGVVFCSFA